MTERPILFSGPMVRALIDGTKTQTRRVVKWQGPKGFPHFFDRAFIDNPAGVKRLCVPYYHPDDKDDGDDNTAHRHYCNYGDPGDRLWVRESWAVRLDQDHIAPRDLPVKHRNCVGYWADGSGKCCNTGCAGAAGKVRPSMFMPRWASRITLEVTGVRVERLQDISENDAKAEGWPRLAEGQTGEAPRSWYMNTWDYINGRDAWDKNPWVWVIEFRKV